MPADRILLAAVLILGVSCQDVEKKPVVVDWEQNNFGIRTAHSGSQEDLLNRVNIDTNAPQIPKRVKSSRHEPRRKLTKPTIKRNELRIRSRSKSKTDEKPSEAKTSDTDHRKEKIRPSTTTKNLSPVARRKSFRFSSEPKSTTTEHMRETLESSNEPKSTSAEHRRKGSRSSISHMSTRREGSSEAKSTSTDHRRERLRSSSEPRSISSDQFREGSRSSVKPESTSTDHMKEGSRSSSELKSTSPDHMREDFRSARFRTRLSPRIRTTTESVLRVDRIEDNFKSSFQVKSNFADFKENFFDKTSISPNDFRQRSTEIIPTTTETTSSEPTSITTTTADTTILTTNVQNDPEDSTTTGKINQDATKSIEDQATSEESISSNTIIDDAVEFVTQTSVGKSKERKKWVAGKHHGDRIIPEIGDPAVAEKLNRLTFGKRGDIKLNRKPENIASRTPDNIATRTPDNIASRRPDNIASRRPDNIASRTPDNIASRRPDNIASRRMSIARSRGTIRTNGSSATDNEEVKKVDDKEAEKLKSRSASRSRVRRPPGINHQFRSNNRNRSKDSQVPKSIKRMRIKNKERKIVKEQPSSDESGVEVNTTEKTKSVRPARFRIPTGRRGHTTRTSVKNTLAEKPVKRLRNPTGRRDHSTPATSTTTTTEKITISPDAHKISYTLDDSQYMEITSENPIVPVENISELSNLIKDEPIRPFAQELSRVVPIPDNMFSQATHQLMKAKKTSAETFLPTLVPLIRKTPTATVSHEVPIFEAGTRQTEEIEEESTEVIEDKPVKRGRYILAATING